MVKKVPLQESAAVDCSLDADDVETGSGRRDVIPRDLTVTLPASPSPLSPHNRIKIFLGLTLLLLYTLTVGGIVYGVSRTPSRGGGGSTVTQATPSRGGGGEAVTQPVVEEGEKWLICEDGASRRAEGGLRLVSTEKGGCIFPLPLN